MSIRPILLIGAIPLLYTTACARQPGESPSGQTPAQILRTGTTVLPSGRLLTPQGRQWTVAPHPFGLCLSRDGRTLVTANSGTGPFSVTILRDPWTPSPSIRQIPPGVSTDNNVLRSVFMGLAFAADHRTLFVSGGDDGSIHLFDTMTGVKKESVSCNTTVNGQPFKESFIGDLWLSRDGKTLYAVDQANFRLVIVDVPERRVTGSVAVGRYPFAVQGAPDDNTVYVANVGMFEYRPVEGGTLGYPPFGVPSREAREGTTVDGKRAPGLGDPNAPESFSVWGVDVSDPSRPRVTSKVKTGTLVGQSTDLAFPAVGGSSPNSLAVTPTRVYVTNGNNDSVQVIDRKSHRVVSTVALSPDSGVKVRGVLPFGLALSPNGRRLYVAEAGLNAVAVIDTGTLKVLGHIPVGWYPSKIQVSPDGGTLYVSNAKGWGSGPNGGRDFRAGPEGTYIGGLMKGTVSVLGVPSLGELAKLTAKVRANNGFPLPAPSSNLADVRRVIKYIVYITKENRTFDEVLGDLDGVRGDASLARYGKNSTVSATGQPTLSGISVMPNHRALAERFAINDNFYADGDVSADGHRWLVGIYPNEWLETQVAAAYGGAAGFSTSTPGRRAFFGSNASSMPEDYNEAGSLFDHLARWKIPFRNYGEGFELAGVGAPPNSHPTGAAVGLNIPMTLPLWENTSREYPIYNMNISDQYRASQFLKDVRRWDSGEQPMPRFVNIALPNDHGAGERPADGYPYVASFMADNDLALGRIVEGLSQTRFWKNMAIFVTEDDAQGGVDHVDAHRTILLAISPYARPGYVSHRHGSLPSVINTINRVFALPPLNQFDATTSDLLDMFSNEPDFRPYKAVAPDLRLFNPAKVPDISLADPSASPRMDDPTFLQRQHEAQGPDSSTGVQRR